MVCHPEQTGIEIIRVWLCRWIWKVADEPRHGPLIEERTLDFKGMNMKFGTRTNVHFRGVAGRIKCVLVVLGQYLPHDPLKGTVGSVGPMKMKSESFFEPNPMLDLDQFVIRDFILADDAMGGRSQLPGINRNGEAHGLV